ncbi:MAG: lytic transglycosylase domain-containing protein, partial [Ferrovum sp.]|nr:lytic transglycosylase domain-containing protein [Ferrovum sp.]
SVFGIGKYLFKFGAVGLLGGLASSTLGLFGLRELGQSAVGKQRESLGLGITPGQMEAFKTDMGRYVDQSILGKVANAQNNYEGRVWLGMATGLNQNQVLEAKPDDLAIQAMIKAHEWWNRTPPSMRTEENLRATGFPQSGFTLEDMRRLGGTSLPLLTEAQALYNKDKKAFEISPETSNAWYKLTRQLEVAGKTIEAVLINKLDALAPKIGNVIEELTQDATALIDGFLNPKNIARFSEAIQGAVEYLGSPKFIQGIKDFGEAVSDVTQFILKVSRLFGGRDDQMELGKTSEFTKQDEILINSGDKSRLMATLEAERGLPSGLLDSVYAAESGRGKYLVSEAGALGPFQFYPTTAQEYGVTDPMNFGQSAVGAANFYADLMKHYHGDIKKSLAAYNWGYGNVDREIKKHGNEWETQAPKETRDYIDRVMAEMSRLHGDSISSNDVKKHIDRGLSNMPRAGNGITVPGESKHKENDGVGFSRFLDALSKRQAKANAATNINIWNDTSSRIAVSVNGAAF